MQMAPYLTCGPCHRIIPICGGNPIAEFLLGRGPKCPACGQPVDVWESILDQLHVWQQIGTMPIGTRQTRIDFDVPKNGVTTIVLTDHGIPKDARILSRTYCGLGATTVIALEVHGQSPKRSIDDGTIRVYGADYLEPSEGLDVNATSSRQALSVTWVPADLDQQGWSSLWTALEAFANYDYQALVVPGNTAVELVVERVVSESLRSIPEISSESRKGFLGDATYHHRLNVLLPALASLTGALPMRSELARDLNELKTLRNQVGHTGRTKQPMTPEQAARLARAALFGFHYVHLVERHVGGRMAHRDLAPDPGPRPPSSADPDMSGAGAPASSPTSDPKGSV